MTETEATYRIDPSTIVTLERHLEGGHGLDPQSVTTFTFKGDRTSNPLPSIESAGNDLARAITASFNSLTSAAQSPSPQGI